MARPGTRGDRHGNTTNDDRIALFDRHLDAVVAALEEARSVGVAHDRLVVHGDH